jgi:hypothetical protein
MAKRAALKAVTVHGWTGHGATKAEAKADAVARIEKAAGRYTPLTVHHRGLTAVICREPDGWGYFILRPGEQRETAGGLAESRHLSIDGTREGAERRARRHLAQNAFTTGEDATAPAVIIVAEDRREFEYWARWQNGIKAHRVREPDASDAELRAAGDVARSGYTLCPTGRAALAVRAELTATAV